MWGFGSVPRIGVVSLLLRFVDVLLSYKWKPGDREEALPELRSYTATDSRVLTCQGYTLNSRNQRSSGK